MNKRFSDSFLKFVFAEIDRKGSVIFEANDFCFYMSGTIFRTLYVNSHNNL